MNMTNHNCTGLLANAERQKAERRAKIEKIEKNVMVNYPKGFTIKEISVDTKLPPYTVRQYLKTLVEEGRCQEIGKEGKCIIYVLTDFLTDKQEETAKEAVAKQEEAEKEQPKVCAGREFENPRSITSVVAGDISWIASRSGNGLFFRYLILIVHSYKATCVNVFPEGHEAVNINDPNFIFVGTDPESEENLYADLTNVCQRRFSAFGERCMHISPEHMENVKNRMARLLKVDIHPVGDQGTIQKLKKEGQKMADAYSDLANENQKLQDEFSAYKLNKEQYIEGLHQQFKGIIHEKKKADKTIDILTAEYKKACENIEQLVTEKNDLRSRLDAAEKLKDKVGDKDTSLFDDIRNDNAILGMIIDGNVKEAKIKLLEKQMSEYLAIIDRLLPDNTSTEV